MEQRLKKQRNKLCCRIILILASVWIVISTAYCVICLYSEKNSIQNKELSELSYTKQRLSMELDENNLYDSFFRNIIYLIYLDNEVQRDWNSQIVVIDGNTNNSLADTADKIVVKYGVKIGVEMFDSGYGLLSYSSVHNGLSDDQTKAITQQITKQYDNGKVCELICTKFHYIDSEFIPLELKTAIKENDDSWFVSDTLLDTFPLENNYIEGEDVYVCNDMRRNTVPKDFFLRGSVNSDIIGQLSAEQKDTPVETVSIGFCKYIFFMSDVLYINENELYTEHNSGNASKGTPYIIQYAKKVNLLDICRNRLIIGTGIIFAFFFMIGCVLCFMMWKIVRVQAIQEQRRTELTNALAHDIKTPLFVISGYAYSLKEDIDSSERDEYLEKIIEQTEEINNMVHKMLNLTKLNSDKMVLNITEFDVSELTDEVLTSYKKLPGKKTIKLNKTASAIIKADRELIKTALTNLIDNAVKYSLPESEIAVTIDKKTLIISNKSEPLTRSELKQIWQPYVRRDKSRTKDGNGLGLSIVKSIFDLHDIDCDMTMNDEILKCCIKF